MFDWSDSHPNEYIYHTIETLLPRALPGGDAKPRLLEIWAPKDKPEGRRGWHCIIEDKPMLPLGFEVHPASPVTIPVKPGYPLDTFNKSKCTPIQIESSLAYTDSIYKFDTDMTCHTGTITSSLSVTPAKIEIKLAEKPQALLVEIPKSNLIKPVVVEISKVHLKEDTRMLSEIPCSLGDVNSELTLVNAKKDPVV